MPPAPTVIAGITELIDPNGFPQVFTGREPAPQTTTVSPSLTGFDAAITKTKASVVKIEGQGCGGIVDGSGFVVGDNLVATNAHVVAGIHRPYVTDANGTHLSRAIWFDPDLDFAILRTNNLAGESLRFDTDIQPTGARAMAMGYPGGGNLDIEAAVVLDRFTAVGRNIYGQGSTARDVYELDARIIPGNSGGPVVTAEGRVIGVVFAQSTTYEHVGYALTAKKVVSEIDSALQRNQIVSTSSCAE
jgi:S1-C subfamily serine protease